MRRSSWTREPGSFGRFQVIDWKFVGGSAPAPGSSEHHQFRTAVLQHEFAWRIKRKLDEEFEGRLSDDLGAPGAGTAAAAAARMERVMAGRDLLDLQDLTWAVATLGVEPPTAQELREAISRAWASAVLESRTRAAEERRQSRVRSGEPNGRDRAPEISGWSTGSRLRPAPDAGLRSVELDQVQRVRELASQSALHLAALAGADVTAIDVDAAAATPGDPASAGGMLMGDDSWLDLRLPYDWWARVGNHRWRHVEERLVGQVLASRHGTPTEVTVLHVDAARSGGRLNFMFIPVQLLPTVNGPLHIDPSSPALSDAWGTAERALTARILSRQ